MNKFRKGFVYSIIAAGLLFPIYVFGSSVFNSNQVGTNPQNNFILSTNGATSTWIANSGGVGVSNPNTCTTNSSGSICLTLAPYYASTNGATTASTTGTFGVGTSGTISSCSTFTANEGVLIAGAGTAGGNYIGTVVSCSGTTLTVTPATITSVSNAMVQHDETAAFTSAIAALASTTGGGTIWLPNGLYLVNGPLQDTSGANAVLAMPKIPNYDPNLVTIDIEGFQPALTPTAGSVIQTSQNSGNFIGGYDSATGGSFPPFTNVYLKLHNLYFIAPSNPGLTMINAGSILDLDTDNIAVQTVSNAQPSNASGTGIIYPSLANQVHLLANGYTTILGYYTAIVPGEHMNINSLYIENYVNALLVDGGANTGAPGTYQGNTIHIGYVWFGPGTNQIVAGTHKTTLQIDTADFEEGSNLGVNDPSNLIYGTIHYNVPFPANGYDYCTLPKSGGANLATIPLWCINTAMAGQMASSVNITGGNVNGLNLLSVGTPIALPSAGAVPSFGSAGNLGGGTGGIIFQSESANVTDDNIWDSLILAPGTLHYRAVNDGYTAANDWLSVTRTGDVPTSATAYELFSIAGTSSTIKLGTGGINPGCIEMYDKTNSSTIDYGYFNATAMVVTSTKPNFCE